MNLIKSETPIFSSRRMRKTSIAKIHVTKTMIVARFSIKNIDCGIKDFVGEKINHEFVYEEKNDRERSKHGQQNQKTQSESFWEGMKMYKSDEISCTNRNIEPHNVLANTEKWCTENVESKMVCTRIVPKGRRTNLISAEKLNLYRQICRITFCV